MLFKPSSHFIFIIIRCLVFLKILFVFNLQLGSSEASRHRVFLSEMGDKLPGGIAHILSSPRENELSQTELHCSNHVQFVQIIEKLLESFEHEKLNYETKMQQARVKFIQNRMHCRSSFWVIWAGKLIWSNFICR